MVPIINQKSAEVKARSVQDFAREYLQRGFSVVPLHPNSKQPSIKWNDYRKQRMNPILVEDLFSPNSGIAIVCGRVSNLTVIDVDDAKKFETFFSFDKLFNEAKTIVETPRGYHLWFSYEPKIKNLQNREHGFDIKNDGGLVTVPPSIIDGFIYHFVKKEGITPLPGDFLRKLLSSKQKRTGPFHISEILMEVFKKILTITGEEPVSRGENLWRSKCPAHDDENPSLDIFLKNGVVRFRCWAGCEESKIREILGVQSVSKRQSTADLLIDSFGDLEFWRSEDDEGWVTLPQGMNLRISSRAFKNYMAMNFYRKHRKVPNTQSLIDAINVFTGKSFENSVYKIYTRIGECKGEIYLDLCNENFEFVKIKGDGCELVKNPPIKFQRPSDALPLPYPFFGNGELISNFQEFLNLKNVDDLFLVLSWLVGCFNVNGEYPILAFLGEREGTGKSTLTEFLKRLVDPSLCPLKSPPREELDVLTTALNSYVICYDNLSSLPFWFSDCLCRLSTGGGIGKRQLYTDFELIVRSIKRPVIINSVGEIIERRDLRRRAIVLELPRIKNPKPKEVLLEKFKEIHPDILGFLLKIVVKILREKEHCLTNLTDMASFVSWICRGEGVFPISGIAFINLFEANRDNLTLTDITENPIFITVKELSEREWEGTIRDLFRILREKWGEFPSILASLPKTLQSLGRQIRRLLTDLELAGVNVEFVRRENSRLIKLRRIEKLQIENRPIDLILEK